MSHMVIFQAPGGSPGYNQFESLEEAVAFVESLRNEKDVTNARMFALEEIKFDLKPYFKVELQALTAGSPAPAPEPDPAPEPPAEPVAEPVADAAPEAAPVDPAAAPPPPVAEPAPASTFGAFSDQQPAPAPAPAPPPPDAVPAPEAAPEPEQPARRGLFGR